MQIDDNIINEAEKLLINGSHFDLERLEFIKSFESCDLLAIPGSGKTTALQAKLYCMSRLSQYPNHKGILVLSHTNAAVEEIKNKLYIKCKNLFEFPNFIGTIQDFIDQFLAIPFYNRTYGHSITRIDSSIFKVEFQKEVLLKKIRNDKVWSWYQKKNLEQVVNYGLKVSLTGEEIYWNYSSRKEFKVAATNAPKTWVGKEEENRRHIKKILRQLKEKLLERGILSYEDCYVLAQKYINDSPKIKDIIRKRFHYVFIDETQDLQDYQLDIIDQLFNNDKICFQRIGDINQSIFHVGTNSTDCLWVPRNPITLNNSLRLSPDIAEIVDAFMLKREIGQKVVGLRNVRSEIKPHILVYDYYHRDLLKTKFEELITVYNLDSFPESKYGYHIVGWNAKWSDGKEHIPEELRLSDLFQDYVSKDISTSLFSDSLAEYILNLKKLKDNKQRIHNINVMVCECLRLCEKLDQDSVKGSICERPFTPTRLKKFIHDKYRTFEKEYKFRKLEILRKMAMSQEIKAYNTAKNMLNWIINLMGVTQTESYKIFISKPYIFNDILPLHYTPKIQIETIHRAKGQTHCATLYVETMYQGKYESAHLHCQVKKKATRKNPILYYSNPFLKEKEIPQKNTYAQNAQKMAYVGLSRPTHLLCYAMHKSSYDLYDSEQLRRSGWNIIDLTKE